MTSGESDILSSTYRGFETFELRICFKYIDKIRLKKLKMTKFTRLFYFDLMFCLFSLVAEKSGKFEFDYHFETGVMFSFGYL